MGGETVAVDSTLLEANAAMKAIVRRDTGEDWKAYLTKLAVAAGIEDPTDEELRRFDRGRKAKTVSNAEWVSPSDPESRIAKLKDGRTHLAYKAEHAVDLDSGLVVAATIHAADAADSQTLVETVAIASEDVRDAGAERGVREVVTDTG